MMPPRMYPADTIATLQPSARQHRLARSIMLALLALTALLAPYAAYPLPHMMPAFAGYESAVIVADCLTATLLFIQFRQHGHAALLLLACGYAATTLLAALHMLSFPGIFLPDGVFGNRQTSSFLWLLWHSATAVSAIGFVIAEKCAWHIRHTRRAMYLALLLTAGATGIVAGLSIHDAPFFIVVRNDAFNHLDVIWYVVLTLLGSATLLVLHFCRHTVLGVWLAVAMTGMTLDVFNVMLGGKRYVLGWYFGPANGLAASFVILLVYVTETILLLRYWASTNQELTQINQELQRASDEVRTAEEARSRLLRAQTLLSTCNAALVRSDQEDALLGTICQRIIDAGGYATVWIGMHEPDREGLQGVACCHAARNTPSAAPHTWPCARSPGSIALTEGRTCVIQSIRECDDMADWSRIAGEHGYAACLAVPLQGTERPLGVLTLYAHEQDALDPDEIGLLEELASNVSYGIRALRARAQRDMAEAATRAKSAFLANMSHEIRTPMNAILGMAYLIRREPLTPLQHEWLEQIDIASGHLLRVLDDILDMSKIEAGKLELDHVRLDIQTILANVTTMMSPRLHERKLQLLLDTQHFPHAFMGDPTRLTQALVNYANNALKFTERGAITIRTRQIHQDHHGALLRFEVSDTGIGIAPEHLSRLFSTFEQIDSTTTRQYGGTGLGLAITRHLASLMGGETGVSSIPGEGSTFWFTARLAFAHNACVPEQHTMPVLDHGTALARRHAGCRVLLVDDDPVNLLVGKEMLLDAGLDVRLAKNGHEAVEYCEQTAVDLILMDMQMPVMDGVDATRYIRRLPQYQQIPIVAMTANAFDEDRQKCLRAGMNSFITKPLEPRKLFALLLEWLEPSASTT